MEGTAASQPVLWKPLVVSRIRAVSFDLPRHKARFDGIAVWPRLGTEMKL
jgi:hypothetical protein